MDKRKYMRREKESLEADLSSMQQKLASLKLEQGALIQSVDELERSIDRQAQEVAEQAPRVQKAAAAANQARERVRTMGGEADLVERDVALAELRESNRHALQCVVDLVKDYDEPQLEGTIGSLMQELQLRPPSRADGSGMGMSLDDRPGSVGSLSVQSLELEA